MESNFTAIHLANILELFTKCQTLFPARAVDHMELMIDMMFEIQMAIASIEKS